MDEFAKFKVPELKAKCKELGLMVGGTKPVLITRLQNYYAEKLQAGGTVSTSSNDNGTSRPAPQENVLNTKSITPFLQNNILDTNIPAPGVGQVSAADIAEDCVSGIPTTEDHNPGIPIPGIPISQTANITTLTLLNEHVNSLNKTATTEIEASDDIASNPRKKKARAKQGDDAPSKPTKRSKKEQPPVPITQTTSDTPATTAVETESEANHKPRKRKPTDTDGKSKGSKKKKTDNNLTPSVDGGSVDNLAASSVDGNGDNGVNKQNAVALKATPGPVGSVSTMAILSSSLGCKKKPTTNITSIAKCKESLDSSEAPPSIVNTPSMPRPISTVPPTLAVSARKKTTSTTAALPKPLRMKAPTNKFKAPRKVVLLTPGAKNVVPMPSSVASSCAVPVVETTDTVTKNMVAKNTVATNTATKNTAAKNTAAKNTVAKNTAAKNMEMSKRAKINLPVRPATGGDAESVLIATAPLPNANTDGKGFVSNTTRVPQIGLVGEKRGRSVNLPLKTTPGCKMALPDAKLAPSVSKTTPQVAVMQENGGTTALQNELQKDTSIVTPAITPQEKILLTSHAHGAPPPTSTRPKLCLPMIKHTPPALIPTPSSPIKVHSLPTPQFNVTTLLHTHFIGRFYASLHALYPSVSPPPVDSNNQTICGIDACVFDSPNFDAAGMAARFWVARFYDVVCGNGWEFAAEMGQGRQAGVLAGLQDIASVESVGGGIWKVNVRERVGQTKERDNSEMMGLFVVGCTGEVIGWDEAATSGGKELRGDGRLKTGSNGQETWHLLRSDWRDHIAHHLSTTLSDTVSDVLHLIALIHPAPNPSFDVTHPHLIHKSLYADPARLTLAARFVLRNLVMADCFSGSVPTTVRSLRLDVPVTQCLYIESVVMPGEIVRSDRGKLASEIGYVQTTESGHYVLAETGQVIGWEQEGVIPIWRGILGCEEFGDMSVKESVYNGMRREEFFGKEIEIA